MGSSPPPPTAPWHNRPDGVAAVTVRAGSIDGPSIRLDAKHYQEEFILARSYINDCGIPVRPMSDFANAWVPGRTKLVLSHSPAAGAPYLKAHDVLMTRPRSAKYVSATRTPKYDSYLLREGMILTPSSGRNLGPLAFVDSYLSRFAMTDIMRIIPGRNADAPYLLAYLQTWFGQALIRRKRTGSNVDHFSPADALNILVVWPDAHIRAEISHVISDTLATINRARWRLDELQDDFHRSCGLPTDPLPTWHGDEPDSPTTFSVDRSTLAGRVDAARYDPTATAWAERILAAGGVRLDQAAELHLLGRYKRYYVQEGYGRPILSGRQILQLRPVNLQHISDRSFGDPSAFVLDEGMTIFTCDGRAEEALGSPAFVSNHWAGWMASNHVMRAQPRDIHPGLLYLALASRFTQSQLKVRATGSVIDALDPASIGDVVIPLPAEADGDALGTAAVECWRAVAEALESYDHAVFDLQELIRTGYEDNAWSSTDAIGRSPR